MSRLAICCIDDQAEVAAAAASDLAVFGEAVQILESSDPLEVPDLVDELLDDGVFPAVLVCDQVMPGRSGVDLLKELRQDPRLRHSRACLLTGLATQEDTIRAINEAAIDHYLAKPWRAEELQQVVRRLLTEAVLDAGIDHQPLLAILDQATVFERLHRQG